MSRTILAEPADRYDLTPLLGFGDITYVFPNGAPVMNPDDGMQRIQEFLNTNFDPEKDYIVFTGNLIAVSWVFGAALAGFQQVRTLVFDARMGLYKERIVTSPYTFIEE